MLGYMVKDNTHITKTCKVCGKKKSYADFVKDPRCLDGMGAKCLSCFNIRRKELYPTRDWRRPRTDAEKEKHRLYEAKRYRTFKGWVSFTANACKQRKKGCSITKDDIIALWHKQKGLCAVTHQPMDCSAPAYAHNKPSLDRIDSSLGYHIML